MPKKLTTEEFIERAVLAHGDKYDYSKVNYVGSSLVVEISCKKHGSFWQTPGNHVHKKHTCPTCSGLKITTESFIKKAR